MTKREKVYDKYNGHCAYCGKETAIKDMQVDHVLPKHQQGTNDIENLFPSCRLCNHYKRSKNLEQYRNYIDTLIDRLLKIYIVRVAISYGILQINPWDKKFYFEKYKEQELEK